MKTELPEPAEYYRPTRARELREKAARLERQKRFLVRSTWGSALASGMLVFLFPYVIRTGSDLSALWLGGTFLFFVAVALGLVVRRVDTDEAMRHSQAEADRLEAEHAARYGALPDEVP
jgi:hypothetical protein